MRKNVVVLAILAAGFLAACDSKTSAQADANAREVGAKLDRAADRAKDQIAAAAKKTEAAVSEGTDKLKPQVQQAGSDLKPKLESAGDQLQAAAHKTNEKISAAAASAETSDTGITATIKAKYVLEPTLSALKIDVDTQQGVVTLNGLARDDAARRRAEQIASSVKGVSSVKNHLTLKQG